MRLASRHWVFWALFLSFWICGWSTNGLIGTHFIPAAHDHGMPETTSASLLALIGIFDIVGTVASGWLTDRVDSRYLLFGYYFLRGLSLLVVPALLGPDVHPSLFLFIVFYGLDWVATVPPTVALCRIHFGIERSGVVFGWVFASHMVGAGVAASYAGWIRQGLGDYFWAWMTAGALCLLASLMVLSIPRRPPADDARARAGRRGERPDLSQAQSRRAGSAATAARPRGAGGARHGVRRSAATAARKSSGWVPAGGGGETSGRTWPAMSSTSRARASGPSDAARPTSWRTETARESGSGAMSARAGPVREVGWHLRRVRQPQPEPVAHDVGAGEVVTEPLALGTDQRADQGGDAEEDPDLDHPDQLPHEGVVEGDRPGVVAHGPQAHDELAHGAAGEGLHGGRPITRTPATTTMPTTAPCASSAPRSRHERARGSAAPPSTSRRSARRPPGCRRRPGAARARRPRR